MHAWLKLCFSGPVVRRAAWSAVIVGTALVLINHGDAILHRQVDGVRFFRICLTVIVPYVVSTVSSVSTLLSIQRETAPRNLVP
jgi:hypothetical protein